jgi:5-aminolevulinate synthase
MSAPKKTYDHYFDKCIDGMKKDGRYREFKTMTRRAGQFPSAAQATSTFGHDTVHASSLARPDDITVWCSNDYMGMGQHPVVLEVRLLAGFAPE